MNAWLIMADVCTLVLTQLEATRVCVETDMCYTKMDTAVKKVLRESSLSRVSNYKSNYSCLVKQTFLVMAIFQPTALLWVPERQQW